VLRSDSHEHAYLRRLDKIRNLCRESGIDIPLPKGLP